MIHIVNINILYTVDDSTYIVVPAFHLTFLLICFDVPSLL